MVEYREVLDGKYLLDKMNLIYKNKFYWFILKVRLKIVSKKLVVVYVSYILMNIEIEMGLFWVFSFCYIECSILIYVFICLC